MLFSTDYWSVFSAKSTNGPVACWCCSRLISIPLILLRFWCFAFEMFLIVFLIVSLCWNALFTDIGEQLLPWSDFKGLRICRNSWGRSDKNTTHFQYRIEQKYSGGKVEDVKHVGLAEDALLGLDLGLFGDVDDHVVLVEDLCSKTQLLQLRYESMQLYLYSISMRTAGSIERPTSLTRRELLQLNSKQCMSSESQRDVNRFS